MRGVTGGALTAALALALATPSLAQAPVEGLSRAESRLADRAVPDIPLRLADGRTLRLSELADGKPLLVTFFYRRCTGVCTPLLEWVRDAVRAVGGLGSDYRVLALSFDDADTVADLRAQADAIGASTSPHWAFAIADRDAIARVTGAVDFWFRRDPVSGQYDHPALLVALDSGRVVRAMLGGPGADERFRELVWELRGAFIASYRIPGQTPFACAVFDPRTGENRLDWGMALLALPGLAAIGAALAVFAGHRKTQPAT
jgi:cytochrome oxidase Cu insertion factor (SCO1/SenC/PrrC family)